jgi:hypothetical protein
MRELTDQIYDEGGASELPQEDRECAQASALSLSQALLQRLFEIRAGYGEAKP